ncbi:MAG: hypothetical protein CL489_15500 [Acidobacteria bacterium]|nr:hypothetical protein [Acidobacteriota bacterium]
MKLVDAPNKKTTGKRTRAGGPLGIVVHHTASSKKSKDENVIQMCIRGVNKVPGPLYNFLISGDGTVWALTNEDLKANHAGRGNNSVLDGIVKGIPVKGRATKAGKISANSSLFGVSIINDGLGQAIPDAQYGACVDICAYLCDKYSINPLSGVIGHLEWTSRKVDPTFDMDGFRAQVVSQIKNIPMLETLAAPRPKDLSKLAGNKGITQTVENVPLFPGTLRRGTRSEAVKLVQRRVGAKADGIFGWGTHRKIKEWQRSYNRNKDVVQNPLTVDGIVGRMTWNAMSFAPVDLHAHMGVFY